MRYIKLYVARVSVETERRYFKTVEEQVVRLKSKVGNNFVSKTKKYFLKNSTIENRLLS